MSNIALIGFGEVGKSFIKLLQIYKFYKFNSIFYIIDFYSNGLII